MGDRPSKIAIASLVLLLGVRAVETRAEPPPANFAGHWVLDKERSEPIASMLELLEVPWYVKILAGAFTPSFAVKIEGGRLSFTTSNPLGTRTQMLYGDGVERPGKDQLEREYRESSRWGADGRIEVLRVTRLPSGKQARVRSLWQVDGDRLTNTIRARVGDEPVLEIRRVFTRRRT